MAFTEKLPEWHAEGIEPPDSKKQAGWDVEDRPPAGWWNWLLNRTFKAIEELRNKAADKQYVDEAVAGVKVPDATLTQKGIVQLSNAIDGDREDRAATEKAVHDATKYADEKDALIKADYVRQPGYAATTGTPTAYKVTLDPAPTSLREGFGITIVPHVDSGANPTISINGLEATPLKKQDGSPAELKAGKPYSFRKVGMDFLADSSGDITISGQQFVDVMYGGAINAYDPVRVMTAMNKLNIPEPSSNVTAIAVSPDSSYVAIALHKASIKMYKRTPGTEQYSLLSFTISWPKYIESMAWSPDGLYLYVAGGRDASSNFGAFKRNGDSLTKLPDPSVMPPGSSFIYSVDATNDIVVLAGNTFVLAYRRNGDTLTKLPNPSIIPSDIRTGGALSPDGRYYAVGETLTVYKINGDSFVNLPVEPTGGSYPRYKFTNDGYLIGVADNNGVFLFSYQLNDGIITKINVKQPPITINDTIYTAVSADGNFYAITSQDSDKVWVYKHSKGILSLLGMLPDISKSTKLALAFSPDNRSLFVGAGTGGRYLELYGLEKVAYKNDKIAMLGDAFLAGYAKETGAAGERKKIVVLFN
ncbi:tail fiber protein [Paenibacillus sp. FSL W8-0194]|uniref:tail fiber protein n=1 Tax=Paenibacillus sp. FSL W8-0194 TaxID=2921711 RepID=UPI0030DD0605